MEFTDEELQEIQTMLRFAYGQSQHTDLSEEIRQKIEQYFNNKIQSQTAYSVVKIQQLALLTFNNQLDNLPPADLPVGDAVPFFASSRTVWKGLGVNGKHFVVQGDYIEWLQQNEMSEFAEDVKRLCVFKT